MPFTESSESAFVKLRSLRVPFPALLGAGLLALMCVIALAIGVFSGETPAFVAPSGSGEEQQDDEGSATEEELSESQDDDASVGEGVSQSAQEVQNVPNDVVVHVAGAVVAPGIYSVPEGSRVQDAVDAAGGLASDAASDAINLARTLQDGEQVLIPTEEQVESGSYTTSVTDTGSASSGGVATEGGSTLVNINTAGVDELDTLPGVGPATAQAIVDERENNGPFTSIEDIQRVSGIGEKKFEKLKDSICV